jgi:hypothetical protein
MSKALLLLVTALAIAVTTHAVGAEAPRGSVLRETDLHVLLDTIRANRKALVAASLNLTDAEGARFWPVYDRYQQEMNAVGDRLSALIEDYIANFRDLSNEKALLLAKEYLAAETERLKVRSAYLDEFAQILPGRTVARFYQIENKMDAVLRYDLAATIPVVEQGATPGHGETSARDDLRR